MGRNQKHTLEARFSLRLESRLNVALSAWAAEEDITKQALIERILGKAVWDHGELARLV